MRCRLVVLVRAGQCLLQCFVCKGKANKGYFYSNLHTNVSSIFAIPILIVAENDYFQIQKNLHVVI